MEEVVEDSGACRDSCCGDVGHGDSLVDQESASVGSKNTGAEGDGRAGAGEGGDAGGGDCGAGDGKVESVSEEAGSAG